MPGPERARNLAPFPVPTGLRSGGIRPRPAAAARRARGAPMLRILRQGQRWVLWFVILVVGGVFVFYLGIGGAASGPSSPDVVVQVGERRYDARDVDRLRRNMEERYRQTAGDSFDAAALGEYLEEAAARSLMRNALLASEAERLGLRVTDPEIREFLRAIPGAADAQGRIDRAVVTAYAERNFGTVRRYQETLRDELLATKAGRLMRASVEVSAAEAREALVLEGEEIDIAFVALDPATPPANLTIDEAAVADLVAQEPERVSAAYQERIDEFDLPERVRARHILLRLPGPAPESFKEQIRAKAQETLERIQGGASFADVALEVSEDPGSKERGGDLGFFPRGRMVKQFEDVAFSLEPGELSDVVETVHGLHIIRVEEKRPPEKTPLEEVQEQIARDLLEKDAADAYVRKKSAELVTAVRDGSSLVDAARSAGVSIERPDPLQRRPDGRIPGLGASPELLAAAFAISPERASLDRIFPVNGKSVMVQLLERRTPSAEEIEPQVEERRQSLTEERRNQVQQAWIDQRTAALSAAGELHLNLNALRSR